MLQCGHLVSARRSDSELGNQALFLEMFDRALFKRLGIYNKVLIAFDTVSTFVKGIERVLSRESDLPHLQHWHEKICAPNPRHRPRGHALRIRTCSESAQWSCDETRNNKGCRFCEQSRVVLGIQYFILHCGQHH